MAIFNCKTVSSPEGKPSYIPLNPIKPPFSYGFPMVFLWFSGKNHPNFWVKKIPALASRNRALLYEGSATALARAASRDEQIPVSWVIPRVMTIYIYISYLRVVHMCTHIYIYTIYLFIYLFLYLFIYLILYHIIYKYVVLYNRLHPWDALHFFSNAEKHAENSVSRMVP